MPTEVLPLRLPIFCSFHWVSGLASAARAIGPPQTAAMVRNSPVQTVQGARSPPIRPQQRIGGDEVIHRGDQPVSVDTSSSHLGMSKSCSACSHITCHKAIEAAQTHVERRRERHTEQDCPACNNAFLYAFSVEYTHEVRNIMSPTPSRSRRKLWSFLQKAPHQKRWEQ